MASKSKKVPKSYKGVEVKNLSTKEYGLSAFIENTCADFIGPLKEFFPLQWEWMLVALYCRLLHTSPLKNMGYYYKKSFLNETLDVSVTPGAVSRLLNLLYFYSPKNYLPAYYCLFNGNIKDVSMFSTAIRETGYDDTVVIADKGFYSESNIDFLEKEGLD